MAKQHGGAIKGVLTFAGVAVLLYVVYRLIAPKVAQAATSPGGIYGNGGYDPSNPYSQPTTGGGFLAKLLAALGLGKSSGGSGGSSKFGLGSGSGATSSGKTASYAGDSGDVWQGFLDAVSNSFQNDPFAPNPELGGDSLNSYTPDYGSDLSGISIPYQPTQTFDVSQWAAPFTGGWTSQDYTDNGSDGFADTTSYTGDFDLGD
jgi:hypothetical protein